VAGREGIKKSKLFVLQGFKFALVGVGNSLISFGVFNILLYCRLPYLYANFIGYSIGMFNSYYWNYRFVFQDEISITSIVKFIVVNVIALSCSSLSLYMFIDVFKVNPQIAYIISLSVTMVINFLFSKFWVFKQGEK